MARSGRAIVGARVIESKAHGKRFCVSPDYRGQGIGTAIIEAGNSYCFNDLDLDVVFGESNEIGALSLYGRQGALYGLGSIEKALRRNSPDAARRIVRQLRYTG